MERDVRRFLRAVIIILITAICAMKLPHLDRSIFHFLIPAISLSTGSRLYLDGLLPLFLIVWSCNEVLKSRCLKCGKLATFVIIFFILVPFTFKAVNVIKIPYYMLSGGLKSIDVEESQYSFGDAEGHNTIKVDLDIIHYGKEVKDFNVSIDLPKSLEKIIDKDPIVLPQKYTIDHGQGTLHIEKSVSFGYKKGFTEEDLFDTYYNFDDYKIILSKGDERLAIIQRGD